ncbi:MAG: AmmeMemoRadiSam system radical SAM enzyme [Methanosphaera sp.]|nr:AmmeMemoRadiSam system radical SAM enzyme [Methanosphaera sp.]
MNNTCNICPNHCNINKNTICGQKPTLDSENIIYTSTVAVDPIEKKPLYHYLPGSKTLSVGSVGCNLGCLNCQNHSIAQPVDASNVFQQKYSPSDIVGQAKYKKTPSISWTYNEPTIHPKWIIKTSQIAKQSNIKTILVTNGYNSQKTLNSLVDYVDAVNVDLKSISDDFYREVCKGSVDDVLNAIEFYYSNGVHVEITNLLIPGYNDDLNSIRDLIKYVKGVSTYIPLHFTRFYPQFKMQDVEITPDKTIDKALDLAKYLGLKYVYPGNTYPSYKDNTYCRNCRHLLVQREGYNVKVNISQQNACNNCNHKTDVILE